MYASGRGVQKDLGQAAVWYRKSAEQGRAAAQFVVAGIYERGDGVAQDSVEALKWATVAVDRASNDKRATYAETRDAIAKKLTPAQVAEAQERAREWTDAFELRKKQ
jgi:TPR repeat protein